MSCYLVTGGAGFIGSALAQVLVSRGYTVVVADNLSTGYRENVPSDCEFIEMDMANEAHYSRLPDNAFDAIFHLAGQSSGEKSFDDPWYDFNSHVVSTFLLLELCRKRNINRFLYASSMSVYGDPDQLPVSEEQPTRPKTYYAAGKLAAEAYIKLANTLGVQTTIFRMFSVYGPGQNLLNKSQGMISIYLSFILENKPVLVKGSKQRFRDFVYIDDVVNAWVMALDSKTTYGKTYNLGSGEKTTVEDLLGILCSCIGSTNYPVEFQNGTPGDQFGMFADISRLTTQLDWKPQVTLKSGLSSMINYYRKLPRD